MKLNLIYAGTCLPDYWGGHHKAHISVPVYRGMTLAALKADLRSELAEGAIMGSDDLSMKLGDSPDSCEEAYHAAKDSVKSITQTKPGELLFLDLEEPEDDHHHVHAYFVFTEQED